MPKVDFVIVLGLLDVSLGPSPWKPRGLPVFNSAKANGSGDNKAKTTKPLFCEFCAPAEDYGGTKLVLRDSNFSPVY